MVVNAGEGGWGSEHVENYCAELCGTFSDDLEVDVFTDPVTASRIRAGSVSQGVRVRIHTPLQSPSASHRFPSGGNSCQQWILAGLAGTAAHSLHIAAGAAFEGDRPLLALSADSAEVSSKLNTNFMDVGQLRSLADVLGASMVTIGSPPGNPADVATRVIADEIGRTRPGPTFYAALASDQAGRTLSQLNHLFAGQQLLTRSSGEAAIFAYAQPGIVLERPDGWVAEDVDLSPDSGESDRLLTITGGPRAYLESREPDYTRGGRSVPRDQKYVPSWIAASSGFIDMQRAKIQSDSIHLNQQTDTQAHYSSGMAEALNEIQNLIFPDGPQT